MIESAQLFAIPWYAAFGRLQAPSGRHLSPAEGLQVTDFGATGTDAGDTTDHVAARGLAPASAWSEWRPAPCRTSALSRLSL